VLSPEHFSATNIRAVVACGNHLAERVVAVSRAAADSFVEHGGRADKVHVVYAGMDPAPYLDPTPAEVAAARRALGAGDGPLVGSFSRLSPWKGQHLLIEALVRLPGVGALLSGAPLFGEEAYAASLHERARALGVADRVRFLGQRDDVPLLMRCVDVVVHSPTAPEPFGRVVLEALLAGRPLVAARDGGTLEIVTDGENGLLFPPGDAAALADAVARLLADPAHAAALAERGQALALMRHTREAFVNGIAAQIHAAARAGSVA
jgi:glycosyltransferase involved in cell wall biosynthesis